MINKIWGNKISKQEVDNRISIDGKKKSPLERDVYLKTVYSEERRPQSDYTDKLALYLRDLYYHDNGRLLDIGCGRGDMLRSFAKAGFLVKGLDISPDVAQYCTPFEARVANLEVDPLPFSLGEFDYVFSKSVIEHMADPMRLIETAYDALAPGGIAVIITPSWVHHAWGPFFLDYTHVTPFTAPSLKDAMLFGQFEDVEVVNFRQLPVFWKYPKLLFPLWLFSKLPLPYKPMYQMNFDWPRNFNKFIRFSKEIMLLGIGYKKR